MTKDHVTPTFEKTQDTADKDAKDALQNKAQRISSILCNLPVTVLENSKQGTMVIDAGLGNEAEARQIWEIILGYANLHASLRNDEDSTDFDPEAKPDLKANTVLIHTGLWPQNWEMRLTFRGMYATDTPAARLRESVQRITDKEENQITNVP